MVSTDSAEIARVALEYGAEVPFMRSGKASDDFATTSDVILEVLDNYAQQGIRTDIFACIYPTAPFVTAEKLRKAVRMMENKDIDSVIPVVAFSYPPQRSFVYKEKYIAYARPEFERARSQDLEMLYHDCGQFYVCRTDPFRKHKSLVTKNTVPLFIDEMEVQDIDNETDWKLAELKYIFMKRGENVPFIR